MERPETVTKILQILYSFIPIRNYWYTKVFASLHLLTLHAFPGISTQAWIISSCGLEEGCLSEGSCLIKGVFSKKLETLLIWLYLKLYRVINKVLIKSGFPFILDSGRGGEDDHSIGKGEGVLVFLLALLT